MTPFPALVRAFLSALFLIPFAAAAEDYAIKFDRPLKVGDRYHISSKGTQDRVTNVKAGDRVLPEKREALVADLTAEVEVLAVSPKGKEKKVLVTVSKFAFQSDGHSENLVPDGTQLTVEYVNKKTEFSIDGHPADEKVSKALGVVFKLSSDETSDDVIFGTDQRQKVGQRWTMNSAAAAAALGTEFEAKFDAKDIQGGCRIQEVVPTAGGEALRIEGDLTLTSLKVPLPEGMKVRKGRVKSKLSGLMPVDSRQGLIEQGSSVDTEILAVGESSGVKIEVATKGLETRATRYTYP